MPAFGGAAACRRRSPLCLIDPRTEAGVIPLAGGVLNRFARPAATAGAFGFARRARTVIADGHAIPQRSGIGMI